MSWAPILFAALGIIDSLGGSAEATKEAIVTLLERLSGNLQILRRHLGEDYSADGDNIDELPFSCFDTWHARLCCNNANHFNLMSAPAP